MKPSTAPIVTLAPIDQNLLLATVPLPLVGPAQQAYLLKGLKGAVNTERAYRADLSHYTNWCTAQGIDGLPTTPALLGQYVSELAPVRKWATISRRLAAVRKWHELHQLDTPIDDHWLRATLKGIQRQHGTHAEQAPAFGAAQLKRIVGGLITESDGVPRFGPLRDKVALLLGFTGAFRRSELVALNVEQVHFGEDGVVVTYHGSKTNQTGQREEKALFYSADPAICPVRCLQRWVALLERTTGPLLVRVRKANELTEERLTDQSINLLVKKHLGERYSAHSLRASFVTTAKLNGADDSEIMQQTKHKTSAMIRRYTRLDSIKQHNAAKKLGW